MNQRRPGQIQACSPVWKALATESKIRNRLRFLAAARADRLCSGTEYLDKTLWMEDRLHVFTPVRMALVLDGPGLPWGLFLRLRHNGCSRPSKPAVKEKSHSP